MGGLVNLAYQIGSASQKAAGCNLVYSRTDLNRRHSSKDKAATPPTLPNQLGMLDSPDPPFFVRGWNSRLSCTFVVPRPFHALEKRGERKGPGIHCSRMRTIFLEFQETVFLSKFSGYPKRLQRHNHWAGLRILTGKSSYGHKNGRKQDWRWPR